MTRPYLRIATTALLLGAGASTAEAQWLNLVNETSTRMPTGAGQNIPATSTTDNRERDYAWGDLDNDGDTDLISVRKIPFTFAGGFSNVLFMNENGVLMDRTSTLANTAINVPAGEGSSSGMLDPTNDRDVIVCDLNNDGWLDVATATTISDVNNSGQPDMKPRYIGHPRVYMNLGSSNGTWLGLQYDYNRIPQLFSKNNVATHPRFCSMAAGDVTGDGYADLWFGDYDTGEVGPPEPAGSDFDHKLLINLGAANPGVFVDQSTMRMGATFFYPSGVGNQNLLYATFGAASQIGDMNGDGIKDVIKQTSLVQPTHVAVLTNPYTNVGTWASVNYKIVYSLSPYFVSVDDLNNDGRLDLIMSDDGTDRYLLNSGNDANTAPNFTSLAFSTLVGGGDSFGGNSIGADMNNDGWNEMFVADVDVDGFGYSRRLKIYHNLGNAPNVTMREETPSVIPTSQMTGTYDTAPIDIDNDGWRDLVIARATSESNGFTTVWMNRPKIVTFAYPDDRPGTIEPDTATPFDVQLAAINGATMLADSGKIHISIDGGAFAATNMAHQGGNLYTATLPATPCASNIRFYLSGQLSDGTTFTDPWRAVETGTFHTATVAGSINNLMNEGFESGAGSWTVSSDAGLVFGAWEVADPNGTWNDGIRVAPEDDNTPAGVNAFVTQNGNAGGSLSGRDVDGGATRLMSPVIDLDGSNATISYAYWFYGNTEDDSLLVEVSNNDGASWTTVATHKGPGARVRIPQNAWKTTSFAVGDFVTPTSTVRVRFTATDASPESTVEAGIDDFRVDGMGCGALCPADITGEGQVNVDDLLAVINNWGAVGSNPADVTGNGLVNVDDLLMVINGWGSCP